MKRLSNIIERFAKTELDGTVSHQLYSPPYRPLLSTDQIMALDPKLAAVNILFISERKPMVLPFNGKKC